MTVGVLYGYGKPRWKKLRPQALSRCNKAAEFYRNRRIEKIYIASVLGEKMREYLYSKGIPEDNVVLDPRGLTSAGETKLFSENIPADTNIIIFSSTYHLPRLRRIWRAYSRPIKTMAASGGVTLQDLLKESVKFLAVLIHPRGWTKTL